MKKYGLIASAIGTLTLFSLPAFAATLPGGASTLQETYEDWTVSCQSTKDATLCAIRQDQNSAQTGQRVLTVELKNVSGGKVDGVILMPFGLDLSKGATLKIDEATGPNALKAGTNLNVNATALSPSQPVAFKISLKGFGAALDRIITLTK